MILIQLIGGRHSTLQHPDHCARPADQRLEWMLVLRHATRVAYSSEHLVAIVSVASLREVTTLHHLTSTRSQ